MNRRISLFVFQMLLTGACGGRLFDAGSQPADEPPERPAFDASPADCRTFPDARDAYADARDDVTLDAALDAACTNARVGEGGFCPGDFRYAVETTCAVEAGRLSSSDCMRVCTDGFIACSGLPDSGRPDAGTTVVACITMECP